jgi:CubicO group peptidase (beta-lactamase class C family)
VIVTRGKILDSWGAVETKFNVHSIRKSFLSALCGIQVEAGKLQLDARMTQLGIDDNPPVLTDIEKGATVRQLLQARSGIYHPALYETASMKARRPQRHSHAPGTFWYYNNWDFNALGTIYEQECHAGIYDDFERLIARRIGMTDYSAKDGRYVTGADSIHRAYPFRMTARDMARFGLLFLRGGKWNDEQIIPAAWVKESTTAWSDAGMSGGYGYLWWIAKSGVHFAGVTLPEGSYSARGAGGHYILVIPALDLVIVHRVNTDIEGRSVSSTDFGELVRLILAAHEPPPVKSDTEQALDTLLPLLMSKHRVPGVGVVAIENHRIAWERYLGVREAGKEAPVTADTIFEAASMTKPLAAHAALKLVEQNKIDLDKPLTTYLPEPYLKNEPQHEQITARMVLTHSSGFPNWRPKGGALKVLHEPGAAFRYSGEGILFLQRVIEQLTSTDYDTHMRSTLLEPLGMKSSSHVWRPEFEKIAAAGHGDAGKVKTNRTLYRKPNAAYSLYTTPREYALWLLEMMRVERDAAHSLKPDTLRLMLTPAGPPTDGKLISRRGQSGDGPIRHALGWAIESTASGPRARHSGSNGTGFRCHAEFDPVKGHGLVIMTNSTNGDDLWRELVERIGVP